MSFILKGLMILMLNLHKHLFKVQNRGLADYIREIRFISWMGAQTWCDSLLIVLMYDFVCGLVNAILVSRDLIM